VTEIIPFEDFGGSGEQLHFAHANAYPPGSYRSFLDLLTQSYRVLAVKHRPLWTDESPTKLSNWEQIAGDLINFCDQNKLQSLIGVGHSLGAVTTMMAALKRPDLFRILVLIEPVFLAPSVLSHIDEQDDGYNRTQWPWVATALKRRDQWSSHEEAFDYFRDKKVFYRLSDDVLSDYLNCGLRMNEKGYLKLAYPREWEARIYALPPTDVWNIIPRVNQPTLAVRGIDSDTLSPEAWSLWQETQPNAFFVELPGSGHLLPMEKPGPLAESVLDFCLGQKL
jgi:pimeloyl-ACP methyl ester carboxylesterase